MAYTFAQLRSDIGRYARDENTDLSNDYLISNLFFKYANELYSSGKYEEEDIKIMHKISSGVSLITAITAAGQNINQWISQGSGYIPIAKIRKIMISPTTSIVMTGATAPKQITGQVRSLIKTDSSFVGYFTLYWEVVGKTLYAYKSGTSIFSTTALTAAGAIDVLYDAEITPEYDPLDTNGSAWDDSTDVSLIFSKSFITQVVDMAGKEYVSLLNGGIK